MGPVCLWDGGNEVVGFSVELIELVTLLISCMVKTGVSTYNNLEREEVETGERERGGGGDKGREGEGERDKEEEREAGRGGTRGP